MSEGSRVNRLGQSEVIECRGEGCAIGVRCVDGAVRFGSSSKR